MKKYLGNAKGICRGGVSPTICAAYGIKSNAKRFIEYTNGFAEPAVIEISDVKIQGNCMCKLKGERKATEHSG